MVGVRATTVRYVGSTAVRLPPLATAAVDVRNNEVPARGTRTVSTRDAMRGGAMSMRAHWS